MKDWKTSVAGFVLAFSLYVSTSPDFPNEHRRWAGAMAAGAAALFGVVSHDTKKTPKL